MKLISCHIENFGGLSDYDLDFAEGLTVLQEPNGFGKTTLAEFIRAMFYGFPRKAKTLDKSKRQKYMPWNGKKCGGNLTFEVEGKQYRLERTFGATPKSDTFHLIDLQTGKKSSRFTEDIGVELFQLDGESFERSTYMPQNREGSLLTTASIQAKLGDLVEDTNDINNFDKAMAALRTKRSGFVPYRGSGGSVAEAVARITEIQRELDDLRTRQGQLEEMTGHIAALEAAQQENEALLGPLHRQIREAEGAAARMAYVEQYKNMEAGEMKLAGELEQLRSRYPGGIPGSAAVEEIRQVYDRWQVLSAQEITTQADRDAKAWLDANGSRFAAGMPDKEALDACADDWNRCCQAAAEMENCRLPQRDAVKLEGLAARFAQGVPDARQLEDIAGKLERAGELRRENDSLNTRPTEQPKEKKNGVLAPVVLIAGILLVALGAVLLGGGNGILGGCLLALGVLAVLGGGYLAVDKLISSRMAAVGADAANQARIQENREQADRLEQEAAAFLDLYGADSLPVLRHDVEEYDLLTGLRRQLGKKQAELNETLQIQRQRCADFLGQYFDFSDKEQPDKLLDQLRWDVEHFRRCRTQLRDWQTRQENHRRGLARCREELDRFRDTYGLEWESPARLRQIREDARAAEDAQRQLEELRRGKEAYYQAHRDALDGEPVQVQDLKALREQEAAAQTRRMELADELLRLEHSRSQLRLAVERIPDLEDALNTWQDRRIADQESRQLLDDTMDFLAQARDSLSGSYLGTIRERFAFYMERLSGQTQEDFLISSELEVRLERQGQARELGYFSAGQTDLVLLCMRFALVDALFTGEKPFVILDDPFVNLDDERTAQALALLKELARDRQIIYLVCHSSRV